MRANPIALLSLIFGLHIGPPGHADAPSMVVIKLSDAKLFSRLASDRSIQRFALETIPELQTLAVSENDHRLDDFIKTNKNKIVYMAPVREIHIPNENLVPATPAASERLHTMWGMNTIEVEEAWKKSQGQGVVVAVSDTGIYGTHSDLRSNLWQNPGETGVDTDGKDKATNKLDDDKNGFVDDTWGWAFNSDNNNPRDDHYHGTHVAGTIAAAKNGNGIVGVAPLAKIMSVKFLGGNGSGTDLNGARSIVYAARNGARIVNCSWGGAGASQILTDAAAYAQSRNVLIVAAAGNDGTNTDRNEHLPSGIDLDNVISVGASANKTGAKAGFSNYGIRTVDLAAPGVDILSTLNPLRPGFNRAQYGKLSGTSMAAPHVSGVAALIWSAQPSLTYLQVKQILMDKTVKVSPWSNRSQSEGVLNAKRSLESF